MDSDYHFQSLDRCSSVHLQMHVGALSIDKGGPDVAKIADHVRHNCAWTRREYRRHNTVRFVSSTTDYGDRLRSTYVLPVVVWSRKMPAQLESSTCSGLWRIPMMYCLYTPPDAGVVPTLRDLDLAGTIQHTCSQWICLPS